MSTSQQVMSPQRGLDGVTARRLPTFSGSVENWSVWCFKFEAVAAQDDGLLQLMDMDFESTIFKKKLKEIDPDHRISRRLYFDLAACMDGDGIRVMRRADKGDGFRAWHELKSKYASNAEARKAMLTTRLYEDQRPHTEEQVETYIDELEDVRRQLDDIGVKVDDAMILGRIKRSLPETFRPLLAALQLQRKSHQDSTDEYRMVIDEIKLWCQQVKMEAKEHEPHQQVALTANAKFQKKQPNLHRGEVHDRRQLECFYCKGRHKKQDCELFARDQERAIREAAATNGHANFAAAGAHRRELSMSAREVSNDVL